jgi:hypothetical protein
MGKAATAGGRRVLVDMGSVLVLDVVLLLIQMTVQIWDGLYAELMHPLGKEEPKRPEFGDRLPRRINHAITWFMAVETKGIKIIVPAQDPVQDAKDVAA